MKAIATVPILLVLVCAAFVPGARAEETAEDKIKKALTRKVSFEFVDTPLTDALDFIRRLSNVAIVVDPKIIADGKDKAAINLRVTDMNMDLALEWILKLAELDYKIRNQAIYIFSPEAKDELKKVVDVKKEIDKKEIDAAAGPGMLRARFGNGAAIEADVAMIKQFPYLAQEILAFGFDPAKDEMLALAPGRDFPPHISVAAFIESVKTIAPDAKFDFDDRLKLLYIRSTEESDLRRIHAIARALRRAPPNPAFEQPFANPNQKVTLKATDRPLKDVLDKLCAMARLTPVAADRDAADRFRQPITLDVNDMELKECFFLVAKMTELRFEYQANNTIAFSMAGAPKLPQLSVKPPRPPAETAPKEKRKPDPAAEPQF